MLLLFTILLVFILLSRIIETSTKIPSTLTLIVASFILFFLFPDILNISSHEFNEILYLMLPVILLPDILNISADELKKHYKEILYLAVIAVVASIGIAVLITPFILPEYQFSLGMLIALFSMLMATDAITVASIMSKFKLPEKLKIYAESESLFNDVTALIIFYFIALPMISGGDVTILNINLTLVKVLVLSITIGILIAYIGYFAIKILKNSFDQFLVIYLIVIVSFMIAEHFHIAGILSIVASVLAFKYLVQKELKNKPSNKIENFEDEDDIENSLMKLIRQVPALSKKDFREYKKESEYIGIFANAIVFIIVANIIDFSLIFKYSIEILIIFTITSILRFITISGLIVKLDLPFRWAKALTFSGAKGALAIIMVHSLPNDFIYKELFNAIVVGNVLLTTFIYTIALMYHISKNKNSYKLDLQQNTSNKKHLAMDLVSLIEKDHLTGAYTQSFIEDIVEKELKRSQRYKTEFSCILIQIDPTKKSDQLYQNIGSIINSKIRVNDYFGRFEDGSLLVLTSNTSLGGAMRLAEIFDEMFKKNEAISKNANIMFGITSSGDTESLSSIIEKLYDAIAKIKNNQTEGNIEIEA